MACSLPDIRLQLPLHTVAASVTYGCRYERAFEQRGRVLPQRPMSALLEVG
jgi:hypothetical protein